MASCVKLPVPSGVCFDSGLIHHVAVSGVHLVHQRRTDDVDFGGHRTDLQIAVDGGGAIAVDQHFGVAFGVEALLGERELIGAGRQIRNRIGTGGLRTGGDSQVGRDIARRDGDVLHGGSGGVARRFP